jgi:hypothetical protein
VAFQLLPYIIYNGDNTYKEWKTKETEGINRGWNGGKLAEKIFSLQRKSYSNYSSVITMLVSLESAP